MTIQIQNFKGFQQSYTLAATSSSQNTAVTNLPTGATGQGGYTDLIVYNASSAVAFINYGMASATATVTSPDFVAPGATIVINMGGPYTNVAIILATGTGNVYFAVGQGS